MQTEFEARFLAIDVPAVINRLQSLGATLHQPRVMMRRVVFKNSDISAKGGWLRLRDEGYQTTLTYKQAADAPSGIDTTLEAEIVVSDFDDTHRLLEAMNFEPLRYQENYREEWRLGDLKFDLDTWPDLSTYLEIEGPGTEAVQKAAAELGLDIENASYGSVDEVYLSELGRDILAESRLVFAEEHENLEQGTTR